MKVAGLFSGIGGLELPFQARGAHSALLCDSWDASRSVLAARFPGVPLIEDVCTLDTLPRGVDVVTAGFPCTDLSQAGRTAGIKGEASGLVAHVFRLLRHHDVEWLVLENVRNMLVLDRGRAMSYLVSDLEKLGFRWAYRLVDSRFTGVPQRRHRVILVASRHHDPRTVLFADEAEEPGASAFREDAFGFYWTEGLTGLGWARDAVPPMKGGSTVGIPSPPAIWIPNAPTGAKLVTPGIEDAEALQGFERGWTAPAMTNLKNGPRWKLVGNAVTVGVAHWLVERLHSPGSVVLQDRWSEHRDHGSSFCPRFLPTSKTMSSSCAVKGRRNRKARGHVGSIPDGFTMRWTDLEPEPGLLLALEHAGPRPETGSQNEKRGWSERLANACAVAIAPDIRPGSCVSSMSLKRLRTGEVRSSSPPEG